MHSNTCFFVVIYLKYVIYSKHNLHVDVQTIIYAIIYVYNFTLYSIYRRTNVYKVIINLIINLIGTVAFVSIAQDQSKLIDYLWSYSEKYLLAEELHELEFHNNAADSRP